MNICKKCLLVMTALLIVNIPMPSAAQPKPRPTREEVHEIIRLTQTYYNQQETIARLEQLIADQEQTIKTLERALAEQEERCAQRYRLLTEDFNARLEERNQTITDLKLAVSGERPLPAYPTKKSRREAADALTKMQLDFEGSYTRRQIKTLLDEVLTFYDVEITEENYAIARENLLILWRFTNVPPMKILECISRYKNGTMTFRKRAVECANMLYEPPPTPTPIPTPTPRPLYDTTESDPLAIPQPERWVYPEDCSPRKTCDEMDSCDEAYFQLRECEYDDLDWNKNGIPCEERGCGPRP
ncbi:hypothetical protein GF339_06335 [candidate division KSB3 bacterium]|uniref:Excalibur calcium-binding domain-containing protein n=1 Tax=candidate division KSB3 bacterium TaxID=2044937 RepID=A0A9D5JTY5_9BACT|nr:hypothetical protein [candidate division KSB3 bacterium]MBD3324183.1 hypothetical protein [candidate division KSB3 bacterium]